MQWLWLPVQVSVWFFFTIFVHFKFRGSIPLYIVSVWWSMNGVLQAGRSWAGNSPHPEIYPGWVILGTKGTESREFLYPPPHNPKCLHFARDYWLLQPNVFCITLWVIKYTNSLKGKLVFIPFYPNKRWRWSWCAAGSLRHYICRQSQGREYKTFTPEAKKEKEMSYL